MTGILAASYMLFYSLFLTCTCIEFYIIMVALLLEQHIDVFPVLQSTAGQNNGAQKTVSLSSHGGTAILQPAQAHSGQQFIVTSTFAQLHWRYVASRFIWLAEYA